MIMAFSYIYTYNFFQTWFHTYLVRARGFNEKDLLLSSLPFVLAACANLAGGLASHFFALLAAKKIDPLIQTTFPLLEARQAIELLASGSVEGKIVLTNG